MKPIKFIKYKNLKSVLKRTKRKTLLVFEVQTRDEKKVLRNTEFYFFPDNPTSGFPLKLKWEQRIKIHNLKIV